MKKNTKNFNWSAILIIILTIVIIGLCIVIVKSKGKADDPKDTTTEVTSVTTQEDIASESNVETTEEDKTTEVIYDDIEKRSDCYVSITNTNMWETDGKKSAQLDIKIINSSNNNITDWEIKIAVSPDIKIDSSWNGEFSVENNNIIIKPVDYNNEVTAKTTLKDIGLIITADSEDGINSLLKNPILYVGGKEYSGVATTEEAKDNEITDEKEIKEEKSEELNEEAQKKEGKKSDNNGKTPYENHGKLSVKGTDIVDENGDKFQLRGVSTHGIAWFPDYVNKDAFATFRDDWNANLIRIAMYTDENGGYCNGGNKDELKKLVKKGVNEATELGMYVIIDWHVLRDCDPNKYKEDALAFFEEMSSEFKDYDNVIYEICNEPNGGTSWESVKAYAEEVIPVIKKNNKDAIVIVGTPNWSQDVDIASSNPVTGYDNIMYAVHFYAATHTDNIRNKVKTALDNGLPVFVSEFSICDASGDGAIDYDQADKWFELINDNNLAYAGWNISNKNESSSLIKSSCSKTHGWTDDELSETGIWLKKQIKGN